MTNGGGGAQINLTSENCTVLLILMLTISVHFYIRLN